MKRIFFTFVISATFLCNTLSQVNETVDIIDSYESNPLSDDEVTNEYAFDDVIITSSIAVARKTPVAVSSFSGAIIDEKIGMLDFPEVLKTAPGIYVTRKGGAYGDSELRLRGFKSENIAVMVNGVPVNDMEWGGIYWSNWAGLADVSRSVQIQRGLGASKVSAPSVGGSVNIITSTIDAKQGGFVSYGIGDNGYNKITFKVSSGLTEKGWAMTLLGGKTSGNGYIQGTEFESYNYFVNISKRISLKHQLSFTAFGAPQWHNQRNKFDGLNIDGWERVKLYMGEQSAFKYNPSYGYGLNGERKTSAKNVYHKPQFSLNHLWNINETSNLSTALYVSLGRGYGYSGQRSNFNNSWFGASNGNLEMQMRKQDGTFDYGKIYAINDTAQISNTNGAQMAMSKSVNNHDWYGLLSTYSSKIGEKIDFYTGVDFRFYKGIHNNRLIDLYGADFFTDNLSRTAVLPQNNREATSADYVYERLKTGDIVVRDYDGYVVQEGIFTQAEYNLEKINIFVAGSISNSSYWRYDRFYYDSENARSDTKNYPGFTVKSGVNYNLNKTHNMFANIGYISRAPFFSDGVFLSANASNITNPDATNEKIFSMELGYGIRNRYINASLDFYRTNWMDKALTRGINVGIDQVSLNMHGVNALHQGIELDFSVTPLAWLALTGMLAIGDWRWTGSSTGYFYNSKGQAVKSWGRNPATGEQEIELASDVQAADHARITIEFDGVNVGAAAQTTASLGAKFKPAEGVYFGVDYMFFDRNYADWNFEPRDLTPNQNNEPKNYEKPWMLPSAGLFDLFAGYSFKIGNLDASVSGNINNLFNKIFIVDAIDGSDHNAETAYGIFYGFGRTGTVSLKIMF